MRRLSLVVLATIPSCISFPKREAPVDPCIAEITKVQTAFKDVEILGTTRSETSYTVVYYRKTPTLNRFDNYSFYTRSGPYGSPRCDVQHTESTAAR